MLVLFEVLKMAEKPQNQNPVQPPTQPSPPPVPQNSLLKVDPSKTISYRQDGADHRKAKK
jgi:hypothetical protein